MARAQYTKLQNVVFCTIKSINRRLDDSLDIPQTVSLALDEFWKRLHVDCWVYTIDQSQKRALLIAYKGLGKNVAEELTACGMNDDFVARLVSSAKPLVICNLIDSPVYKESMLVRAGYRSLVIIPVRLAKSQ